MKKKSYLILFFVILGVVLVFDYVDYLIHELSPDYAVPSYYFTNKAIFGTILGFVSALIFWKQKLFYRSLYVSLVVSVLLQTRYYLEGYSISFVLEFLVIHFMILLPVCYFAFKYSEKWVK